MDADALHALAGGQLRHGDQMAVVGVNAPGTDKADQVERVVGLLRPGAQLDQDGPAEEVAGRDRLVDPRQVLQDRLAGTQVEVADLRVAHLALGQTDELLRSLDGAMRPTLQELDPVGHVGLGDGVDGGLVPDAEAVKHDQHDWPGAPSAGAWGRHAGLPSAAARALAVTAARATMPAISSGLSDAPPTRPPSIECSARNSPIFALVTLPPYRTGTSSAA